MHNIISMAWPYDAAAEAEPGSLTPCGHLALLAGCRTTSDWCRPVDVLFYRHDETCIVLIEAEDTEGKNAVACQIKRDIYSGTTKTCGLRHIAESMVSDSMI